MNWYNDKKMTENKLCMFFFLGLWTGVVGRDGKCLGRRGHRRLVLGSGSCSQGKAPRWAREPSIGAAEEKAAARRHARLEERLSLSCENFLIAKNCSWVLLCACGGVWSGVACALFEAFRVHCFGAKFWFLSALFRVCTQFWKPVVKVRSSRFVSLCMPSEKCGKPSSFLRAKKKVWNLISVALRILQQGRITQSCYL